MLEIIIENVTENNLKNVSLRIPHYQLITVTGVSGSGKTSLLGKVIFESYLSRKPASCSTITGFENFSDLIYIEQPIQGVSHNTTIGSKLGISKIISRVFVESNESKERGFKTSHFIKGSHEGRCPACEGIGFSQESMDFLSDVISPCERCGGSGFRDEVLGILINGKMIYDVLQIPLNELSGFIDAHLDGKSGKQVISILDLMRKTGLGHLTSGRSMKTLSNGIKAFISPRILQAHLNQWQLSRLDISD